MYEQIYLQNLKYAEKLREDGKKTKEIFNQPGTGFIRYMSDGSKRFIEAIATNPETGVREQISGVSVDIAFALDVPYRYTDEHGVEKYDYVISDENLSIAVATLAECFIPNGGVANYSQERDIAESKLAYHRGKRTVWLDKGAMSASGLIKLGLQQEEPLLVKMGLIMGDTTCAAIEEFGSCLELFVIDENGNRRKWKNPNNQILVKMTENGVEEQIAQEGCRTQAWVVGKILEYIALRNSLKDQYTPAKLLSDVPFEDYETQLAE